MKHIVSASVFTVLSSMALANPAPAATTAPKAESVVEKKSDSGVKFGMRIHLDPFYKNLNDAAKNYKTPKLDSFRLMAEREFGKYSKADVEIRLHELEKLKTVDGKQAVNTDTLKYFHILFNVPFVEELELGYVRELEPALFGYTDKIKSTNITESPSFTGHMGRVEGYRLVYKTDEKGKEKVTYHVARNPHLDETTLGTKPSNTTWYHKLTTNTQIEDTAIEFGLGVQGKWLQLSDSAKLKYDSFYHLVAEHKMDDMKIKVGIAADSYAVVKENNGQKEADDNSAITSLVGVKYDLLPKELTLISELGYRKLALASDGFTNYSDANKSLTNSSAEVSFVLAGQYFLDDKLSFVPSYSYYMSTRSQENTSNNTGKALDDRDALEKGGDRNPAKNEQALGLRIRYDY